MSDKSNGKPMASMLYNAVPAVAQLNQVAGFDPRKMLRRTVRPDTNEPVLKLDLRYKRLWFRLACPNGRLHLKPLKISEQMAIFEAKVFLDREVYRYLAALDAAILTEQAKAYDSEGKRLKFSRRSQPTRWVSVLSFAQAMELLQTV